MCPAIPKMKTRLCKLLLSLITSKASVLLQIHPLYFTSLKQGLNSLFYKKKSIIYLCHSSLNQITIVFVPHKFVSLLVSFHFLVALIEICSNTFFFCLPFLSLLAITFILLSLICWCCHSSYCFYCV